MVAAVDVEVAVAFILVILSHLVTVVVASSVTGFASAIVTFK